MPTSTQEQGLGPGPGRRGGHRAHCPPSHHPCPRPPVRGVMDARAPGSRAQGRTEVGKKSRLVNKQAQSRDPGPPPAALSGLLTRGASELPPEQPGSPLLFLDFTKMNSR